MTRRRNTASTPRALDPTRARRASQAAAVGQVAGEGMGVDPSGRLQSLLGDGFYKDGDGVWQVRVGRGIALSPGSPKRLVVDLEQPAMAQAVQQIFDASGLEAAIVAGDAATLAAAIDYTRDIDGGSPDTWDGPDVVYGPRIIEPLREFDGGVEL